MLLTFTFIGVRPPTSVNATVLTSRTIEVTWDQSTFPDVTGYLISYITTAIYTINGSEIVNGGSTTNVTLDNLEEDTPYTITIQTIYNNITFSTNSDEVLVKTYTDSK